MLPHLVLLHGSSDSHRSMLPLAGLLRPWTNPVAIDFIGHGGRPACEQISVPLIAEDVVRQLDERGIDRAFFLGFSLGGYVAMYLARHYPDRVRGICTIASKVVLDANTIAHWVHIANPERSRSAPGIANPTRAEDLAALHHPEDWAKVQQANREMYRAMATQPAIVTGDLKAIRTPALVISGDADQIVSAAETRRIAEALRAQVFLFNGPAHPIVVTPLARIAEVAGAWIAGVSAGQNLSSQPVLH